MSKRRASREILLINPWICDFAAYDLWSKPLGLMYVGAALRRNGYRIRLIDCLDRNHPEMQELETAGDRKPDGRGKYHREIAEKPGVLKWVPRHFARYGYTEDVFHSELLAGNMPDAILITSMMTYWYKGIEQILKHIKDVYPDVPVLVGGIYPTLCPDHASGLSGVDHIITGYGEKIAVRWLDEQFDISAPYIPEDPAGNLDLPWDLYPDLSALVVQTARGCPYRCTFCATNILNGHFSQRSPAVVTDEILYHTRKHGIDDVVFYDDALFVRKRHHIEVILQSLIESGESFHFHTPNGLFARMIDPALAQKMADANFRTIRLSLETSDEDRRADMSTKVSNRKFLEALDHLEAAGISGDRVEVYLLMGLPDQREEEVARSLEFVHDAGAVSRLASFTPIPGTVEFRRAVDRGDLKPDEDPLLWNNTVYALRNNTWNAGTLHSLREYSNKLNASLDRAA